MSALSLTPETVGTLYCVGRNYVAHAKELNNPVPSSPVIFTKARSTVCAMTGELTLPGALGRCDHETEVVIRIGKPLYQADEPQALSAISHIGMGLDLTLRDKQTELKQKSHPWDLAKSFINACPLAPLIPFDGSQALDKLAFSLLINGETRQQGNSADMIFNILGIITFLSAKIPLMPGDLIMTGTPEGVGPLHDGDQLELTLQGEVQAKATVVRP